MVHYLIMDVRVTWGHVGVTCLQSKEHVGYLKGHVTANQKYAVAELRLTERKAQVWA